MSASPEVLQLDIRGQVCPSSLLLVLREVNARHAALMSGACQLIVDTDNRDATGTIPQTVTNMGYTAQVEKVDGYYRIKICGKQSDGVNSQL